MKTFFKIIIISIFFFSVINVKAQDTIPKKEKFISIKDYVNANKLSAKIKGLGGFSENCIVFELTNKSNDTLFVLIEAGRRLVSEDSSIQDILLVKKNKIILPPLKSININGFGFCCQASNSSPYIDSKFDLGFVVPEDWLIIINLFNKYDFGSNTMQQAIWVLSDNHAIASVTSTDTVQQELLRKTLSQIKGIKSPWYNVSYLKDSVGVISNNYSKIWGNFKYSSNQNAMITINVRHESGKLMKILENSILKGPGEYDFYFDFSIKDWPKGLYFINVYTDQSKLIKTRSFEL